MTAWRQSAGRAFAAGVLGTCCSLSWHGSAAAQDEAGDRAEAIGSPRAQQQPRRERYRIRLRYQADPPCGGQAELERQILARTELISWAGPEEDAPLFQVRVTPDVDRVDAELTILRADAPTIVRKIRGQSCQEVLEALGLVIALTADPGASTAKIEVAPQPPPAEPAPPPPDRSVVAQLPGPKPDTWRFGGGSGATVLVGVGPGPLPGVEAFLDATLSGAGVAPSLRAGLRHAERAGFHEPEGSAAFQLTTLWAETCPLQLLKSKTTALRPCFGAQYGVLEASGSQVADAQSQRHPWATADAALRLEWRLLGSASLELTAAVAAPLVRSRFVFENRVFHEVRPVVTRLGVGLSVRLP